MSKLSDLFVKLRLDSSQYEKGLKGAGKKTGLFGKGIMKIGGLIAGAFAVSSIVAFGKELLMIGGIAEGVRTAFNRIADDKTLEGLTEATKGTVSQLELMKRAVSAHNLGLPVEKLAKLFEFATKRAQETGESVDFLVNSIVTGIGRKSPLILDNLGISAIDLRKKLKGVGMETASVADIAAAVGEIAADSMSESGEIIDTNAIKVANLAAQWDNLKLSIAENGKVTQTFSDLISSLGFNLTVITTDDISTWEKWTTLLFKSGEAVKKLSEKIEKLNEERKKSIEFIDEESAEYRNQIALEQEAALEKVNHVKTIGELKAETEALTKSLDDYGINQDVDIQNTLRQIDANKKLIESLTELRRTQDADVPDTISGVGTPSFGTDTQIPSGLANMEAFLEKNNIKVKELLDELQMDGWQKALQDEEMFLDDLNANMEAGIEDFIGTFAEGIGRLASGDIGFDEFFNTILDSLGQFLVKMGTMLIAYGIAMSALLTGLDPYTKIAAGIALVAIGSAISGLASKGPSGASSVGGGGSSAGGFSTQGRARASQDRVVFELEGTKLIGVINNTARRNSVIA